MATSTEDVNTRNEKGGTFHCEVCGLHETYHYYGRQPPFHRAITFMEDCYLAKDPFRGDGCGSFLLLGAMCVACGRTVCQAATCSLFYARRFCLACASANLEEFPQEVQQRIKKKAAN